ncbi:hypothetical protein [Okeania sp. SIO2G5]|uniref:hypothetical protein n=1 Tax=Okeania sp. SIO2G5 TaxID=2607796 RepID=UPI0013BF5D2D|nr:hypothetical protein [Okeania sp. SIO2G5]NEP76632.1 hypothetical protein [Okeania sp. SIO2G5]
MDKDKTEQLIMMAQDEMTEYSTDARKVEKLRRKFSFAVPYPQQKAIRDAIAADLKKNFFWTKMLGENRQMLALPFWGIGGLALLLGISFKQPLDFIAVPFGFYMAFQIQKWGWNVEAKKLVIQTLDDIQAGVEAVKAESTSK